MGHGSRIQLNQAEVNIHKTIDAMWKSAHGKRKVSSKNIGGPNISNMYNLNVIAQRV